MVLIIVFSVVVPMVLIHLRFQTFVILHDRFGDFQIDLSVYIRKPHFFDNSLIFQPFLQDKITLIHQRHTGYLGGSIDLNESTVLYASALYQTQASATEVLVGSSVGFILNPDHDEDYQRNTILFLGAWYRYHDAIAPYVAIEWSRMRIGLSYDINISNFYTATSGMGSYEISLLYFGKIHKRDKNPTYSWSCPKLW